MKIYMAGPLFTSAEIAFNAALATLLRMYGHEVFLPQEKEQGDAREIFASDVNGIDWAQVVVANMDGADPDSGTCWECGYAFAQRKPILVYRTDIRADKMPGAPYNLMMTESATWRFDVELGSPEELAQRIHNALGEIGQFARRWEQI